MRRSRTRLLGLAGVLTLALLAAACSNSASAGTDGSAPSIRIISPSNGMKVSEPFALKLDVNVSVGEPDTGEDHVHIGFDGQSVDVERNLVFGESCTVTDLAPGRHTIEASLRNADHTAAGPSDTITIIVAPGADQGTGSGACGITPAGSSAGGSGSTGGGYGY